MLKRLAVAGTALAIGLAGAWKVAVAEYFGRVDLDRWEAEHPSPTAPRAELGPHRVALVSSRRVVPSTGLAVPVGLQIANNNLDVARHEGRVYLAWRSAPSHFASAETLGGWVCKTDLRKYDSPLVFTHDDDVYVVGRRNSRAAAT